MDSKNLSYGTKVFINFKIYLIMEFIDLKAQQRQLTSAGITLREDIQEKIKAVLDHGKYILGPEVNELEEKLANFVGVNHCICVSSGTDALLISLMPEPIA